MIGEDIRFVEPNGNYAPGTYEVVAVTWVASDGYAIAELTVEPWES